MTLDVIPEPVYYTFAERWLQTTGTHLPENIFHDIYTRASGYTWYIQYVLNRLFEMHPKQVQEADVTAFLKKYNLPAMSSVKRVIDYLKEKEYIYPSDEGYIIYDRFMAIWLQRL